MAGDHHARAVAAVPGEDALTAYSFSYVDQAIRARGVRSEILASRDSEVRFHRRV